MQSMKVSEFFRIVKPEYVFLKIKPNNSIRNNGTHKIARTISSFHKPLSEIIKKEREKFVKLMGKNLFIPTQLNIYPNSKVTYFIYMEKKKVEFYFIVSKHHVSLLKEKLSDVWSNVTIQEVDSLPQFSDDALKYQLTYKKEDALSLSADRRNSDLLNSNLNVVEMLEEGDQLGIIYNFLPSTQRSWRYKYQHTISRQKNGRPVERDKMGYSYLLKTFIVVIDDILKTIGESIAPKKKKDDAGLLTGIVDRLNGGNRGLSESTMKKGSSITLPTEIILISQSENKLRERNAAISLSHSFDAVTDDNELISKPFRKKFKLIDYSFKAERNILGDQEAQNFLSLAGRDVLERHDFIEKIETHETEVPLDLCEGTLCIGTNKYRGKLQKAYLSDDEHFRNLLTLLIGPTRAGKSNLIANLCVDAIEADECVIILDFIENCELSDDIARMFPKDKVLEIRCDDLSKLQGLGYNEVGFSEDTFAQYDNAKKQTANVLALINSINTDESRLSPKMERYLESASLVVFLSSGSIKDVFGVLLNHKARHNFISKVPSSQFENMDEYMESLYELDEYDKSGVISGTKSNLIVGIIDRLNTLKRNAYFELMLKKDTVNNIDLCDEIQKAQLITIKLPQDMFPTEFEKDTAVLYWLTKIWMTAQIRASTIRDKSKRKKVNLIIDEIYQCPYSEKFLTSKLSQLAKFIMKPMISCHYLNQLKFMRDELRSANTSYMLISGCDSKNFAELKSELYPFTDEDLRSLPRYHSMNYVKNKDGYARFITKLPGKVEERARLKNWQTNIQG